MSARAATPTERPLPHNKEAERSVLGAVLLDGPPALEIAIRNLQARHFFIPQNRKIFAAMLELGRHGTDINAVTVLDQISRNGIHDADIGAYISQLADGLPRGSAVASYAQIIVDAFRRRQAISNMAAVTESAWDPTTPFEHTVERIRAFEEYVRSTSHDQKPEGLTAEVLIEMSVKPRKFIVEGLLRERSMSEIFSWRGVGKTWFALTLAIAVAKGTDFLRWKVKEPRHVVYVDGELDLASLKERIVLLDGATKNLTLLCIDALDDPFPSLVTAEAQQSIDHLVREGSLLILDNLSALAPSSNERESEDWTTIQKWLLALRRRGVSSIFLHHAGHAGHARGTTKREDLLDLVLELRKPKDYSATEGLRFELHFGKTRAMLGQNALPIEAKLTTDLDSKPLWTTRDVEDLREKRILEMVANGMSQRDIAEELGIPKSTVAWVVTNAKTKATS